MKTYNGQLFYEIEDIKIGEIYSRGHNKYIVKDIKEITRTLKDFEKKDPDATYKSTTTFCICKKTTDLNGPNILLVPEQFNVTPKTDSFQQIIFINDEDMSDIISNITDGIEQEYMFDVSFDDGISFHIHILNNIIYYFLEDENGYDLARKSTKK